MRLRDKIVGRIRCVKLGHIYGYDGDTLGGHWIKCLRCNRLDEWLPGLHEPKGYNDPQGQRRYGVALAAKPKSEGANSNE